MAKRPKADQEATPNLSADEIAEYYVEYTEMMGQIARIRQRISVTDARYKEMGVNTKAVKACYRLANMDDAPDFVKEMLKAAAILKIIPAEEESDGQMTFLPGLRVAPPSAATQAKVNRSEVFWSGYDSGNSGDLVEACPFNAGSEDFVTWRDGWQEGRKDWEAKPKNANTQTASAEKRPRGRPRRETPADATQLQKDEDSYRAQATESLQDVEPVTGTLQ